MGWKEGIQSGALAFTIVMLIFTMIYMSAVWIFWDWTPFCITEWPGDNCGIPWTYIRAASVVAACFGMVGGVVGGRE